MRLLGNPSSNPKIAKGLARRVATFPLNLAPYTLAGRRTVCPKSTAACRALCLHTAGNQVWQRGKDAARIRRTRLFFDDRAGFMRALSEDIERARRWASRRGCDLAIRLNTTSDVLFERIPVGGYPSIFEAHPDVLFYDYTKIAKRLTGDRPKNYTLTYSHNGRADDESVCVDILDRGGNVAVVVAATPSTALPPTWRLGGREYPTIDGDVTDLRFDDPPGHVVLLRAKGAARKTRLDFVKGLPAMTVNDRIRAAIAARGSRLTTIETVTRGGDVIRIVCNPRERIPLQVIASEPHVRAAETRAARHPDLWSVVDHGMRKRLKNQGKSGVVSVDLSRVLRVGSRVFRVHRVDV